MVLHQGFGHARAVVGPAPRHRRQNLHRHLGAQLSAAHLLLHAFGKQFDQGQSARYPAQAAIKAARQLLQATAEAPLQLQQQPAFLQCCRPLRHAYRAPQHQSFDFAQRPHHRLDRVPPQLLQSPDALIAVHHQVTLDLILDGHHHNGCLLSAGSQGSQQAALPLGSVYSQVLPTPIQLVKLDAHGFFRPGIINLLPVPSGIARVKGVVDPDPLLNQQHKP